MLESDFSHLIRSFLEAVTLGTNSTQGAICLKESISGVVFQNEKILITKGETDITASFGCCDALCSMHKLFAENKRSKPLITQALQIEGICDGITLPQGAIIITPIKYQESAIGIMALSTSHTDFYPRPQAELCQMIASVIAQHIKRYEFSNLIRKNLGKDQMLVGTSDEISQVDKFIEKASRANLPVLIMGEFGSEKAHIAYSIHYAGLQCCCPLIRVVCATLDLIAFKTQVCDLLKQANEITVFFDGIDELEHNLQYELAKILEVGLDQWAVGKNTKESTKIHILATASLQLDSLVREGKFCRALVWEFNFLLIRLTPLRDRKEDLRHMITYFLGKYSEGRNRRISDEVFEICETYDWPENVRELEHVMARLATMAEGEVITTNDISIYAPELLNNFKEPQGRQFIDSPASSHKGTKGTTIFSKKDADSKILHIARGLIREDYHQLTSYHPGIQKSLIYLAKNFSEGISLRKIAQHANLSTSHFGHLFRKTLGMSFKSFLTIIRIEKAKQLLVEQPYQNITEISDKVGYGEIRHFQRMFKYIVGHSPSEYRRAVLNQPPPTVSSLRKTAH